VYRAVDEIEYERGAHRSYQGLLQRLYTKKTGRVHVDADYADFNIQHEVRQMQDAWGEIGKIFTDKFGVEAPVQVFSDLAASLDGMQARYFADSAYKPLVRGLWSGWRATSYINTTFNLVYSRMCAHSFYNMYGYMPLERYQIAGDDVDGVAKDELTALLYLDTMSQAGFVLNPTKQLVSYHLSEFLRILVDGETGVVTGSLNRSLASFIGGDLQSGRKMAGPEQMQGVAAAVRNLQARGMCYKLARMLRDEACLYWGTLKAQHPTSKRLNTFTIPRRVWFVPSDLGGLGLQIRGERISRTKKLSSKMPPFERNDPSALETAKWLKSAATQSYMTLFKNLMSTRFSHAWDEDDTGLYASAVLSGAQIGERGVKSLRKWRTNLYEWAITVKVCDRADSWEDVGLPDISHSDVFRTPSGHELPAQNEFSDRGVSEMLAAVQASILGGVGTIHPNLRRVAKSVPLANGFKNRVEAVIYLAEKYCTKLVADLSNIVGRSSMEMLLSCLVTDTKVVDSLPIACSNSLLAVWNYAIKDWLMLMKQCGVVWLSVEALNDAVAAQRKVFTTCVNEHSVFSKFAQ
jgi:hypothetical protein